MLGRLGGHNLVVTAPNLGVDAAGGRSRCTFYQKGTLAGRGKAQRTRLARLHRLGRGHRPAATQVFRSGILAGSTYGAQVWGLDAKTLRQLQTD